MKTLDQKEWVAVIIAVFVVGFFFIFGQTLVSFFTTTNNNSPVMSQEQLQVQDTLIGGGDTASTGDRVTVHYVGHFPDGRVFDSSIARNEPFQFVLGSGLVIKGWDLGVVGMRVGGKRTLVIPPSLGYGSQANGPIPGNSTLVFDIELLKVEK
jgi:FKBP-type peptidyl-prolyl cis-trans isomerase